MKKFCQTIVLGLGVTLAMLTFASPVDAKIVARNISIVIDATDPARASDIGATHISRIFYDDSAIDPVTQRVPILHNQHTPMLIPFHPDPAIMPMSNAWLDLSTHPLRYHMAGSPAVEPRADGSLPYEPYAVLFDETSRRMTIRSQADGHLILAGNYTVSDETLSGPEIDFVIYGEGSPASANRASVQGSMPDDGGIVQSPPADMQASEAPAVDGPSPDPTAPLAVRANSRLVALQLVTITDQIGPEAEGTYEMGQESIARIVYDASDVDPVTNTVHILEQSHLIGNKYFPNRYTGASILDLSSVPYRLTYASSVFHGRPVVVLFEGDTRRMAILARPDFHVLIAGHYTIDPEPVAYDRLHPER